MNNNGKRMLGGSLILIALGYLAGILTAPKSGKETRKIIREKANQSIIDAEKQLKILYSDSEKMLKKMGNSPKVKKSRDALMKQQKKIKELLSNIHDDQPIDEDLNLAIAEAKKSLKSLSGYLKK